MTEDEAKIWLQDHIGVSRETQDRLEAFVAFLRREAESQNLISKSTFDHIWTRHIVDSAQLLQFLPPNTADVSCLDLGSGAGFPGLVVAMLSDFHVTLVESRTRRVEYLHRAVTMLDLEKRVIVAGKALERLESQSYSVISARAFAPLPKCFELASRFSTDQTTWLLPKGRNAAKEWAEVEPLWDADFRIETSVTDPEAGILVGHLSGKRRKTAKLAGKG